MKSKADLEKWYSKEDPWGFNNTVPDKIRRMILLEQIGIVFSDGSRKCVLDAGCGEGYITRDVASTYNADVEAFDISENALAIARRKNPHENINYFQLDLNDYVPDKKYDLIMCEEALYYLTDDQRSAAVRKFHAAIKDEGHFKITSIIVGETRHRKYFTPDSIKELLVNNGFQVVSIMPSVIQKRGYFEKAFYIMLEYMNRLKLVPSGLLGVLIRQTLNRPLDRCRAISLLAQKVS